MKTINCSPLYIPYLTKMIGCMASPHAQCIVCVEDERAIAGVLYDGFNGASIMAHIWVDVDKKPSREWFAAIFDYPFNRLGVVKIVGQVKSTNEEALRLDRHLGFVHEATIADYYEDADLLLLTMKADQCRILTSKVWVSVVERVKRA